MTTQIISKVYGKQVIDSENYTSFDLRKGTVIYNIVNHLFNEWYDNYSQRNREIRGKYFGEMDQPAIYSVEGAIMQGMLNLMDEIAYLNKAVVTTKDIVKMDIECAFE
jgi:hypothetical protein